MKRQLLSFQLLLIPFAIAFGQQQTTYDYYQNNYEGPDYTTFVNPMMGTGGNGQVTPIASVPFGMMQVGPDTRNGGSGYHYDDKYLLGFSHFHKSGGGCSDYLDILFQPVPGKMWNESAKYQTDDFAVPFTHKSEEAHPGCYTVTPEGSGITTTLTATARCAFHRYQFPEGGRNYVAIDLKHGATGGCTIVKEDNYDTVRVSRLHVVNPYTIEGCRFSVGQARDEQAYFYAIFSRPFKTAFYKKRELISDSIDVNGTDVHAVLRFETGNNEPLYVRVGISTVSTEGARLNLMHEIPDWNFDAVRQQAKQAWNRELSKINITTSDEHLKRLFYTSFYFTRMYPMLWSDIDGQYRGTDSRVHKTDGFNYYAGHLGLWDTFRALCPLLTLTEPAISNDLLRTFQAIYDDHGQLPVLIVAGNETYQMTGLHSMPIIADAYRKGIRGYDANRLFEAMKSSAMRDTTGFSMRYFTGLKNYKRFGYVPADLEMEATARTLDYAYDDWCIAQMAKMLGRRSDYQYFSHRALNYRNVFDPSVGFMRGRFSNGHWREPFDPFASNHRRDDFCEGNSWQWTFSVPHDVRGLAKLMGGNRMLCNHLDSLFSNTLSVKGAQASGDISGLIGQYAHGNEPSHHIIYMYSYLGQSWKTQRYVHQVLTTLYDNTPTGICGNEDTGQMSAWFVLSSLGFYQVRHGDGTFVIASPSFDEANLSLPNGKKLTIRTHGLSSENIYIHAVKRNGKPYSKVWFDYDDLMQGGDILFEMSSKPDKTWGTQPASWPPSGNQ